MKTLLENENRYGADEELEKEKRIKALERLTKKQYMTLNTLVIGFITRYLELMSAFDVITSCIRELEYHQSAVQGKSGVQLPDAAYLQKEGEDVKKIVAAWIEQILEFPNKLEYLAYMENLKNGRPQKFKETAYEQLETGVVRITIRKQYNNNAFPDDMEGGE